MLHASSNGQYREIHAATDLIRAAHPPEQKMDPEKNIDEVVSTFDEGSEEVSVDDFIKQLEEKEKDLHITADTSVIEIAEAFGGDELPDFLKEALDKAEADANKLTVVPPAPSADKAAVKRLEM